MPNPFKGPEQLGGLREAVKQGSSRKMAEDWRISQEVSPAEQIRYEQNKRFGEQTYAQLRWFCDHTSDLKREDIVHRFKNESEELTSIQRGVLERVQQRVLEAYDQVNPRYRELAEAAANGWHQIGYLRSRFMPEQSMPELIRNVRSRSLTSFVKEHGPRALEKVGGMAGRFASDPIGSVQRKLGQAVETLNDLQESKPASVNVTPLGAVVVRVKDQRVWDNIRKDTGSDFTLGIKVNMDEKLMANPMMQKLLSKEDAKIGSRFVYVFESDVKPPHSPAEVETHELLHDLYGLAIQPETRTTYRDPKEQKIFLNIKDELLAYLLANREWRADPQSLAASTLQTICMEPGKQEPNPFKAMKNAVKESRLSRAKTPEEVKKEEAKTEVFYVELVNVFRSIARMKLIDHQDIDQAAAHIMTAQSLKEISYHLEEKGRPVEVSDLIVVGDDGEVSLPLTVERARLAQNYSIRVKDVDALRQVRIEQEQKAGGDPEKMKWLKALDDVLESILWRSNSGSRSRAPSNVAAQAAGLASMRKAG